MFKFLSVWLKGVQANIDTDKRINRLEKAIAQHETLLFDVIEGYEKAFRKHWKRFQTQYNREPENESENEFAQLYALANQEKLR